MRVYLMRHCEAKPGAQNDAGRGLTAEGVRQAGVIGEFLRRQIGRADIVVSSDYARATQTAALVAAALGCHVASTAELRPLSKPAESWKEIERLAQQSGDVVVVGHHPEIGRLIDALAKASGIGHDFTHGAVALVDNGAIHWMVTPALVEADERDAAAHDVAEAAVALFERVKPDTKRSLRHPDHARRLNPVWRRVRRIMARYFEAQGTAIVAAIRPTLGAFVSEAEREPDSADKTALQILPDTVAPLRFVASSHDAAAYRNAIEQAILAAEAQLQAEGVAGVLPETAMTEYLRENSLSKLTGSLADATKDRLRNAIAEAVRAGGTADDIVEAIESTVDTFSHVRAEMIAQTEVNDAYNAGRRETAVAAGLDEKAWITESGNPCIVCIANEAEGWIPIDGTFLSGDDSPTAHPNCMCGLDFRQIKGGTA